MIEYNMIYISAQPDNTYFHWQVELYLWQFSKHGIIDQCYALLGYRDQPSSYGLKLADMYKGRVLLYKDSRTDLAYIPSIRPHLLSQFFKEYPHLGQVIFYHDSDIFLVKLPPFDEILQRNNEKNIGYVSDTISYIGCNYIDECYRKYKAKYNTCPNLLTEMCNLVGIDCNVVRSRNANSGGAQYLLKNIDYKFWDQAEILCNKMYTFLQDYDKKYKIDHGIQIWTTDMWIVLWLYWKDIGNTLVIPELEFSWATSSVSDYHAKNIFHLAGITAEMSHNTFYKSTYCNVNVFDEYRRNKKMFDHVDKNNATYEYTNAIKEYCGDITIEYEQLFFLYYETDNNINVSNIFQIDNTKTCFDKPVWKSLNGKYIIFSNKKQWVLTYSVYISEISEDCYGGVLFNDNLLPYTDQWNAENVKCMVINDKTMKNINKI